MCVLACLSRSFAYLAANLQPSITQGKGRRFFLANAVDAFGFLITTTFEGLFASLLAGIVNGGGGIGGASGGIVGGAEFEGSFCQK